MSPKQSTRKLRNLVIVLGDQLDPDGSAFDGFDPKQDAVLMMEVAEEATYVPQHAHRLVLFFSAMRHLREALERRGRRVIYTTIEDPANTGSLGEELARCVTATAPKRVLVSEPGDHRVTQSLRNTTEALGIELDLRVDRHFFSSPAEFSDWAKGRKQLLLETYYRHMRKRHGVLMDGTEPVGGRWNFDADNRESFGKSGPANVPPVKRFEPDRITRDVMSIVGERFAASPGRLESFDHPVTPHQAEAALADFISHRLPMFGRYQDAMATGHPYLFHSLLSSSLNLHLLNPRTAVNAAVAAFTAGGAPLNAVEGFVRQVLGWREYVRGIFYAKMPGYAKLNALDAQLPMPAFMWDADTDMNCVRHSVEQLVEHAYAHHIQRLMVLGLFALLLGVRPLDVHRWHLSMYIDAIDWVSLPNVLGMSQYADGGIVGSKPYCASGNYINRMSDYCKSCRYQPAKATGENACPITTLYWDFLARNRQRLADNRRMGFQFKNLERKDRAERRAIAKQADALKSRLTARTYL